MSEAGRRILTMLAEGKIAVDEAERLLAALGEPVAGGKPTGPAGASKPRPKYLRVTVDKGGGDERVNIRVPLQLLRAGLKLSAVLPDEAKDKVGAALRDKGIDLDLRTARPEDIEELIESLAELTIDVDDRKEKVRIYCE